MSSSVQCRREDRPASAAAVEAELRAGLAAQGAPYGATEAIAEARRAVASAKRHRDVMLPAGQDYLPGVSKLTADDVTTRPGDA